MKRSVGIIGASGYTGAELLRLIASHPKLEVKLATGDSQAGKKVRDLYPHLSCYGEMVFSRLEDSQSTLAECELVFCGLPHGESMQLLPSLKNPYVIDLGSDFRLKDPKAYKQWYQREHTAPDSLSEWQYGLPELFRERIKGATRVTNPGCYATAAILGLAPLYTDGLIQDTSIVNAFSGTSGAGRTLSASMHASHTFEDLRAYKITAHQHTPEIEAALILLSGRGAEVCFTAHLAPISRGIHATCSARVNFGVDRGALLDAFQKAYRSERFVAVVSEPPGTKEVRGSNMARIAVNFDERTKQVIVTVVIDNLVKGAAGQALQNSNIVLGLPEDTGLNQVALYP